MPTYEYKCSSCGHEWEVVQRIVEDPLTQCPSCHEATAHRQICGGNFILKGGGWYADLYSSPSNRPPKQVSGSAASDGSASHGNGSRSSGDSAGSSSGAAASSSTSGGSSTSGATSSSGASSSSVASGSK